MQTTTHFIWTCPYLYKNVRWTKFAYYNIYPTYSLVYLIGLKQFEFSLRLF